MLKGITQITRCMRMFTFVGDAAVVGGEEKDIFCSLPLLMAHPGGCRVVGYGEYRIF